MATLATRVSFGATAFNVNSTPKTVAVVVQDGDRIAVGAVAENAKTPTSTAPSGGGLTYGQLQSLGSGDLVSRGILWSATVGVGQGGSFSVSIPRPSTDTDMWWGGAVWVYRGSDGFGNSAGVTTGSNTLDITTTADNSTILVWAADWNAADGTTRGGRSVNGSTGTEETYFRDSTRYTVYMRRWDDAGAAGSKTVGYSTPTGQATTIFAVEVKGAAGALAQPNPILRTRTAVLRASQW